MVKATGSPAPILSLGCSMGGRWRMTTPLNLGKMGHCMVLVSVELKHALALTPSVSATVWAVWRDVPQASGPH